MHRFKEPWKRAGYLVYRWLEPVLDPIRLLNALPGYGRYLLDGFRYSRMPGAERMRWIDTFPQIHDRLEVTPFDHQYFYQNLWAFRAIRDAAPKEHVDVASHIQMVSFLTTVTSVTFVDIRPLEVDLPNYRCVKGSVLGLPFDTDSIPSLSCLHVAEHIGLGRYGDPLDPEGTRKAAAELARVLAPGGTLYFSLPVGKPRLCFNAHRIHSPGQVLEYFRGLSCVSFSGIDDAGRFREGVDPDSFREMDWACGLFIFRKPAHGS